MHMQHHLRHYKHQVERQMNLLRDAQMKALVNLYTKFDHLMPLWTIEMADGERFATRLPSTIHRESAKDIIQALIDDDPYGWKMAGDNPRVAEARLGGGPVEYRDRWALETLEAIHNALCANEQPIVPTAKEAIGDYYPALSPDLDNVDSSDPASVARFHHRVIEELTKQCAIIDATVQVEEKVPALKSSNDVSHVEGLGR